MTYDEAKADAFEVLLPQIGSQFRWLIPGKEEHAILWGLNRKERTATFTISYTNELVVIKWTELWFALSRQLVVPIEWK